MEDFSRFGRPLDDSNAGVPLPKPRPSTPGTADFSQWGRPIADEPISTSPTPSTRAAPAASPDDHWAITRGFWNTVLQQNPEMLGEGADALGILSGTDALRAGGQRLKELSKLSPEEYALQGGDFWEQAKAFDFEGLLTSAGEAVGQVGASWLPSLGGAAAGAGLGAVAGAPAGPGGALIGAGLGARAGATAPNYVMATGEIFKALKDEGVDEVTAAKWAASAGVPFAALDTIAPLDLAKKAMGIDQLKREVARGIAKRLIQEAGKAAVTEGATEGAQEAIKQGAVSGATGENKFDPKDIANSVIAGAIGGGAMGGAGGIVRDNVAPGRVEVPPGKTFTIRDPAIGGVPGSPLDGEQVAEDADQTNVPANMTRVVRPDGSKAVVGKRLLVDPVDPNLTRADRESPLPDEAISTGKRIMDEALGGAPAVNPSAPNGSPPAANGNPAAAPVNPAAPLSKGGRVSVTRDGKTVGGVVEDVYSAGSPELGTTEDGVRIRLDDGRVIDDLKATLDQAGVTIAPETTTNAASPLPSAPGTEPGGAAAPTSGVGGGQQGGTVSGGVGVQAAPQAAPEPAPEAAPGPVAAPAPAPAPAPVANPEIEQAANQAATSPLNDLPEPSDAQKEAGNYKVGRLKIGGMDISVENPKGSIRSKTNNATGEAWSVEMPAHYGRLLRTKGADGDHLDVYVGDDVTSDRAFVIDQYDPETGKFDEHKTILGVRTKDEAIRIYDAGFSDGSGPRRRGGVTPLTVDEFREAARAGTWTAPLSADRPQLAPDFSAAGKPVDDAPQADAILQASGQPWGKIGPAIIKAKQLSKDTGEGHEAFKIADGQFGIRKTGAVTAPEPQKSAPEKAPVAAPVTAPEPERLPDAEPSKTPIDLKAEKPKKEGLTPKSKRGTLIGTTRYGHPLYEDERGIRSYVSDGIRLTEAVQIIPGGGISINKADRTDAFKTAEEAGAEEAARKADTRPIAERVAEWKAEDKTWAEVLQLLGGPDSLSTEDLRAAANAYSGKKPLKYEPKIEAPKKPAETKPKDDLPEHPGLIIKSLQTGKETRIQPAGTRPPTAPSSAGGVPIEDDRARQRQENIRKLEAIEAENAKTESEPKAEPKPNTGYGAGNKVFTEEAAAKARALLKAKLSGSQLNSGLDPEIVTAGVALAGYHIEAGARTFAAYTKAMVDDLGEVVRPFLRSWYEGVRYYPGFDATGMTPAAEIENGSADNSPVGETGEPETGSDVAEGRDVGDGRPEDVAPEPAQDVRAPRKGGRGGGSGSRSGGSRKSNRARPDGERDAGAGRQGDGGEGLADAGPGDGGGRAAASVRPDFYVDDPESLIGGTPKVRFQRNRRAIETFRALSEEGREPTQDELQVMASYIGWGSFGQELFQGTYDRPRPKDGWQAESDWLREHLGKAEWESAQNSIINAHYTDPPTVMAMWDIVRAMGFKGGRVLEPSMGIGNFFSLMPRDLHAKSDLTGIELDKLTGGMAKILHPGANISIKGYQESQTPDDFYDLVIGNWPFSEVAPADRRYDKLSPSLHDFFFLKALDQVRPGGLVVGITSSGTMDKVTTATRGAIARKADLVAAYRLPSGAFEKYAGTVVVTDLLIFQKREEPRTSLDDVDWLQTTTAKVDSEFGGQDDIRVNDYFWKNPTHVLGALAHGSGTTFNRAGMIVRRPTDLFDRLNNLRTLVPQGIYQPRKRKKDIRYETNNTGDRQGSIVESKGGFYVVQGERLAALEDVVRYRLKDAKKTAEREDQIRQLIAMRRLFGELIDAERDGDAKADTVRPKLKKAYDAFRKVHGPIQESDGLSILNRARDPFAPALAALERPDGTPAAILSRATVRARRKLDNPSVRDAFVLSRNESAFVDLDRVAELSKRPREEVERELLQAGAIYRTPGGGVEVADVYLSGNVRRKMREALDAKERGEDMDASIEALKGVIPKDVPYFQIEAKLGASWVNDETYKAFVAELLGVPSQTDAVNLRFSAGSWRVRTPKLNSRSEASAGWGTDQYRFDRLVQAAMNNQTITIKRKDRDGKEYVDTEATKEVADKITKIREEFGQWLWRDAERRVDAEKHYNEVMNAIASPRYDGSFLEFPGMALSRGDDPFSLRQHQVNAIWRGIANGRGLFAHEVGTGKTYTMGGIAVESRRYGLMRKPLIVAHNANSASVAREIQEMYPGAQVLYIDNLSPDTIDATMQRIATDDWDAVVIPHSLLNRMALSEKTLMEIAAEDIAALEAEAMEAADEDGATLDLEDMDNEDAMKKVRSVTAKQLVKQRNRIIEEIKKQAIRASKEGAVTFENLGIDGIIVDEAHEFKKPPIATKMKMRGLNTASSAQSVQLKFLTDYVKKQRAGKGVFTFTGTPITNTLTEIFNQMRYVMDDEMARASVKDWDHWFNTFADATSDVELTDTGDYEPVTRLAAFVNVAELRRMAGQYMDIVFASDMPEFTPRETSTGKTMADKLTKAEQSELLNGRTEKPIGRPYKKVISDVGPLGADQEIALQTLVRRAQTFKNASGKDRRLMLLEGAPEVPIRVGTDAANAGLDVRLFNPEAEDDPNSKVNRAVRRIVQHFNESPLATQAVFVERGFNDSSTVTVGRTADGKAIKGKVKKFALVADMVDKLVAGGIPRDQIAVVDGSVSKEKRKEIADKMNRAEIRVVIGNTKTLGVGVNMQVNLRAMHHLDAPWMPGDLEQRNGRGERQGNKWNTVLEYRYITEKLDGRRWQVLMVKDRFIKAFLKADDSVRVIEGDAVDDAEETSGDSLADTLAQAAGDPRLLLLNKFKADVEKLENRERQHTYGIADARRRVKQLRDSEGYLRERAEEYEARAKQWDEVSEQPFTATVGEKTYDTRTEAQHEIDKLVRDVAANDTPREVAVIRGIYRLYASKDPKFRINGEPALEAYLEIIGDGGRPARINEPSIASVEGTVRNYAKRAESAREEIAENEGAIERLSKMAEIPFAQQTLLETKRKMRDDVERDLQANPVPAPSWLRQGAPVDTEIFVAGERRVVEGHKWTDDGYFIVTAEGLVPYLNAKTADGLAIYDEREFKPPVQKAEENKQAPKAQASVMEMKVNPQAIARDPKMRGLIDSVIAVIDRVAGPNTAFSIKGSIPITDEYDPRMAKASGKPDAVEALGLFLPVLDTIEIAMTKGGIPRTLKQLRDVAHHEAFHKVQFYLLTERERAVLKGAADELRAYMVTHFGDDYGVTQSELEAYAFQIYASLRDEGVTGPALGLSAKVRMIFDRLYKILRAVRNAVRGNGFQTWEDVFERAYSGEMAQTRTARYNPAQEATVARENAALSAALAQVMERIAGQVGSATTQVATTIGSYRKAAAKIAERIGEKARVLDYGAGLGLGTDAMRDSIANVDSYEPFPERWRGQQRPTFTSTEAMGRDYDALVNLNVLNVLEPALREAVLRDMLGRIKPGGVAVIGTRGWSGDVASAQNTEPATEPKAVWVVKGTQRVYQKGFDGLELVDYVRSIAGPGFDVERVYGIAKSTVIVTRKATKQPVLASVLDPGDGRFQFEDEESEARFQDALKGVGAPTSMRDRLREFLGDMAAGFTRHYLELPNIPRFADLKEQFRKLEAAPTASVETILRYLQQLTGDMTPADYDLFARKVILDDLSWEVEQEHLLPFGLTPESVASELDRLDEVLADRPDLVDKVRMRKVFTKQIANKMVAAGVLDPEQIRNPSYYRHQVLDYARAQVAASRVKGSPQAIKTPKWAKRMGSTLDINANLLEAEFEWMHKALTDIATADTITWIKESEHNIRDQLVSQAKESNRQGVREILQADIDKNGWQLKNGKWTSPLNEEWKGFRQRIGMGFAKIREVIDSGALKVPARFQSALDAIEAGDPDENTFGLLAWMLDNDKPGSMGAAMIMKAIGRRRQWTRKLLGSEYVDPTDIKAVAQRFAPEGYKPWQPDKGKHFFTAKTIPEHVMDRIMDRLEELGEGVFPASEVRAAMAAVRPQMVVGGDKYTMIVPEEVANTLDSFRDEIGHGLFDVIAAKPLSLWKRWMLFSPFRILKYNLNNLTGDLDAVIAGNPRALRWTRQAFRELRAVMGRNAPPSQDYRDAIARGVFDSNLMVQEIPELGAMQRFENLREQTLVRKFSPLRLAGKAWSKTIEWSQLRENVFRYAAYLDYVDRLEKGESMESIGYGAAAPQIVDAVTDPKDKAALLARQLVGDYGNVSYFGRRARKYVIPFYSWMEINTRRYWRLGANAMEQGVGRGLATGGILAASMGVKTSIYLFARMALLYGAVQLWNNLLFPDEEDEFDDVTRLGLHLTLGRTADGEIRTLKFQGALSDYLAWLGFPDVVTAIEGVDSGQGSIADVVAAIAKAPVNKIANGLTPLLQVPLELASGKEYWPDVFNPRGIRDRWQYLAGVFGTETTLLYNAANGLPDKGAGGTLAGALVQYRDPGEIAYNELLSHGYDWVEEKRGSAGISGGYTEKSNALYYFKKAQRLGDKAAERAMLQKLQELGVTRKQLAASIKRSGPLGMIAKKDRAEYLRSLTPRQRDQLARAEKWWKETFKPGLTGDDEPEEE